MPTPFLFHLECSPGQIFAASFEYADDFRLSDVAAVSLPGYESTRNW